MCPADLVEEAGEPTQPPITGPGRGSAVDALVVASAQPGGVVLTGGHPLTTVPAGDTLDGLRRLFEQVRRDGGVAAGEHFAGSIKTLGDDVGVSSRILADGAIHDLDQGHVGENSQW